MQRVIVCCLCLCFSFKLFAQDSMTVHQDPRLEMLSAKQASVNKFTSRLMSNGQYRGFRLQLMSTRVREDAFKLKADLMQMFPTEKAYVLYQAPYFKVRLGNFISKDDAVNFRKRLASKYTQIAYIVEDAIDYTPAEDEDIAN